MRSEKQVLKPEDIRLTFGGDLLRQGIVTSMGARQFEIPLFGLYGACSTSGEALALGAMCVGAGYGEYMLAVTSSHFACAEKEFRFPLGYASQRPLSAAVDCDRKWCIHHRCGWSTEEKPCEDHWNYNRKDH